MMVGLLFLQQAAGLSDSVHFNKINSPFSELYLHHPECDLPSSGADQIYLPHLWHYEILDQEQSKAKQDQACLSSAHHEQRCHLPISIYIVICTHAVTALLSHLFSVESSSGISVFTCHRKSPKSRIRQRWKTLEWSSWLSVYRGASLLGETFDFFSQKSLSLLEFGGVYVSAWACGARWDLLAVVLGGD